MNAQFVLGTIEEWIDGECPNDHLLAVLIEDGIDIDCNQEGGHTDNYILSIKDHVLGCCISVDSRKRCTAIGKLKFDLECMVERRVVM